MARPPTARAAATAGFRRASLQARSQAGARRAGIVSPARYRRRSSARASAEG